MNITIKYDLKNNRYDYLIMMTIVSVIFAGTADISAVSTGSQAMQLVTSLLVGLTTGWNTPAPLRRCCRAGWSSR